MKRILALHGHSQSAHIFSRKVAFFTHRIKSKLTFQNKIDFLRQALKDEVEFGMSLSASPYALKSINLFVFNFSVFLDAPHILVPVDPQSPYDVTISSTATVDKHTPRCWWKYLASTYDDWAVIESLLYIKNVLEKEGPFNVCQNFLSYSGYSTFILSRRA